jgi:hypothetical protein
VYLRRSIITPWVYVVSIIIISGHKLFIRCRTKRLENPLGSYTLRFPGVRTNTPQSKRFVRMYFTSGVRRYSGSDAEDWNVNWSLRVNWTSVGESLDYGWYRIPACLKNNTDSLYLFFGPPASNASLAGEGMKTFEVGKNRKLQFFHSFHLPPPPAKDEEERRKGAKWVQFRSEYCVKISQEEMRKWERGSAVYLTILSVDQTKQSRMLGRLMNSKL